MQYLHREIWQEAHGPLPEGHEAHHRDGNPLHNVLDNLECLTFKEHGQRHRDSYRTTSQLEHLQRIRSRALAGLEVAYFTRRDRHVTGEWSQDDGGTTAP